ncbi:MAG: DUF3052 family protein [Dehalococcoidia bacterium]|nr:DUF3052 family protein [Dehalococcoidia bacterium]
MGLETVCTVRVNGKAVEAKALLEKSELIVRAPVRLKVPFSSITSVEARDGELVITHTGGEVVLALGPKAKTWAEKIKNPRGLLDKLGVKPGMSIAVVGVQDGDFLAQLGERVPKLSECKPGAELDLVFFETDEREGLEWLESLGKAIKKAGAIWIVAQKGSTEVREVDVLTSGRAAGLVNVKVAAFSETHTAHKMVVPKAARAAAGSR